MDRKRVSLGAEDPVFRTEKDREPILGWRGMRARPSIRTWGGCGSQEGHAVREEKKKEVAIYYQIRRPRFQRCTLCHAPKKDLLSGGDGKSA